MDILVAVVTYFVNRPPHGAPPGSWRITGVDDEATSYGLANQGSAPRAMILPKLWRGEVLSARTVYLIMSKGGNEFSVMTSLSCLVVVAW